MGTALLSLSNLSEDRKLERSIWYMGGLITIHIDSAETSGAYALIEGSGSTGGEPPLHMHEREDELFYVIEGKLDVIRGDERIVLHAGDAAFLPRLVPHTFRVASHHARFLNYISPGGFEEYFRKLGTPAASLAPDPNPPRPDFERITQTAAKFGITFYR